MEEYKEEYENENYINPQTTKSIKGLRVMIIILALILGALSVLYFTQVRQIRQEFAIERDTLTNRLTSLLSDYDNLQTENDTINSNLLVERGRTDSLLQRLQGERKLSYSKIKDYEKQLGYMRSAMTGYLRQIDSLNTINKRLGAENTTFRKEITSARLRAETAEEKATELSTQVRKGAVVRARNISLLALSAADREVTRANRAARLRVDFVLVGNELSRPGKRNVYVRIIGPENFILTNSSNALFDFEGEKITYSATREIDYQNEDLSVSLYYNGSGITSGKYNVLIYMDGNQIGSNEIILR